MEFKNILEERFATKNFDGKKIDEDKIEQIMRGWIGFHLQH